MKQVNAIHRGKPQAFAALIQPMTGLSPEEARLLIAMGGAYVNNKRCKDPEFRVPEGAMLSAWFNLPLKMTPVAFDPAWIVTANSRYLVAAKPAGLPTQGRRDADYMAFYLLLEQHVPGYLGLHHRLDQDTSGLLLFSREKKINKDIAHAFSEGLIHKQYLAVCSGNWPFATDQAEINLPLGPKVGSRGTVQQVTKKGKQARTLVARIAESEGLTLVAATPKTGRTHQIRAHLAHHGLPLLGDGWYGGPRTGHSFLLHCCHLGWPDVGLLKAASYYLPVPQTWNRLPQALFEALPDEQA